MAAKAKQGNILKMKRLADAIRGFDVLAVVYCHEVRKREEELDAARKKNSSLKSRIVTLKERYGKIFAAMEDDHYRQMENVHRNHEKELNESKERYEKELTDCKDEFMQILEEDRRIYEVVVESKLRDLQQSVSDQETATGSILDESDLLQHKTGEMNSKRSA